MSVGPTRGPVQRPGLDRDLVELFQRVEDLERVRTAHRMPHVNLRGDQNGVTFVDGVEQTISFDTFLAVPINHGGEIDPQVFELEGSTPWDHIDVLSPGVYWGEARCGWFIDWGAVGMNLILSHTDGDFSVSDSYGLTNSLPTEIGGVYPGGLAGGTSQTAVVRRGYFMVDEYAENVEVSAVLKNSSGTNRTASTAGGRPVGAQLFVIRLAGSGHSNP